MGSIMHHQCGISGVISQTSFNEETSYKDYKSYENLTGI